MPNPYLQKTLTWVADHFRQDPSKMLIWTGVAGWAVSSLAQIVAILFNPKISDKEKSFLIPQEMSDALVNIAAFFTITNVAKLGAKKLFQTGKIAPKPVREFLNSHPLYSKLKGNINFNLDNVLKEGTDLYQSYNAHKGLGTTAATIGGGILAVNVVTPLIRNSMASRVQKNYIEAKQLDRPQLQTPQPTFKGYSYGLKI